MFASEKRSVSPAKGYQMVSAATARQRDPDQGSQREFTRSTADRERPRFLIVDPDAKVRDLIRDVFSTESHEIVYEDTLERCADLSAQGLEFDVILMDLSDPVERVFDLMAEVKERSPAAEIIFVSHIGDEELWIESIQRGAFDLLPKPLNRMEVERVLKNAIELNRR